MTLSNGKDTKAGREEKKLREIKYIFPRGVSNSPRLEFPSFQKGIKKRDKIQNTA